MRFSEFKQDKGVAGLTILLSLIVMLFVIGLIVMIFALMGNALEEATYDTTAVTDEVGYINSTGYTLTNLGSGSPTLTGATNYTDGTTVTLGNLTITAGVVTNATAVVYDNATISYTYEASNTGTDVINDTVGAISGVTDWFSIFVVIGSMVVLILLTVIIITAIRGSGMIETGSTSVGKSNVGSA